MFGLALIGIFILWVITIILSVWLPYKFFKKHRKLARFFAILGFMLTIGGWFIYWAIEYAYIQAKVNDLCEKEAGIAVYVTPEEWRKQIGEEEWNQLYPYKKSEQNKFDKTEKIFDGVKFTPVAQINKYVIMYSDWEDIGEFISKNTGLLVDQRNQKILVKYISISAGTGAWLAGGSPKVWLHNLKSCSYIREKGETDIADQYSNFNLGD